MADDHDKQDGLQSGFQPLDAPPDIPLTDIPFDAPLADGPPPEYGQCPSFIDAFIDAHQGMGDQDIDDRFAHPSPRDEQAELDCRNSLLEAGYRDALPEMGQVKGKVQSRSSNDYRSRARQQAQSSGGGKKKKGKPGKHWKEVPPSPTDDSGRLTEFVPAQDVDPHMHEMTLRYIRHLNGERDQRLTQTPTGNFLVLSRQAPYKTPPKKGQRQREQDFKWVELRTRMPNADIARLASGQNSIYLSVNTMGLSRRRAAYIEYVNAIFLDCDIYKTSPEVCGHDWAGMDDEAIMATVRSICKDKYLPEPTMVTHSGGGLYLLWAFDKPIPAAEDPDMLKRWRRTQDTFCALLEDQLGADKQARDVTRVLRLPGSYNCKYGEPRPSRILFESEKRYEPGLLMDVAQAHMDNLNKEDTEQLALDAQEKDRQVRLQREAAKRERELRKRGKTAQEIFQGVLDERTTTGATAGAGATTASDEIGILEAPRTKREVNRLKKQSQVQGDMAALKKFMLTIGFTPLELAGQRTLITLNWTRFQDLLQLLDMRGGVPHGKRDLYMFWMLAFLGQCGKVTPKNMNWAIGQMMRSFPASADFDPANDGTMDTLRRKLAAALRGEVVEYQGALYSPMYTPRNTLLIELFKITPQEQESLTTIIAAAEVQRRRDLRNGNAHERRQQKQRDISIALALSLKAGWTMRGIAQSLDRSHSTISRWLRQYREVLEQFEDEGDDGQETRQSRKAQDSSRIERRGRRSKMTENPHYCQQLQQWKQLQESGADMSEVPRPQRLQPKTPEQIEAGHLSGCELRRRSKSHARAMKRRNIRYGTPASTQEMEQFMQEYAQRQARAQIALAQCAGQPSADTVRAEIEANEEHYRYVRQQQEAKQRRVQITLDKARFGALRAGRARQKQLQADADQHAQEAALRTDRNRPDTHPAATHGAAANSETQHVIAKRHEPDAHTLPV